MKKILIRSAVAIAAVVILLIVSGAWSGSHGTCIDSTLRNELDDYCRQNNLSRQYCIVVDFSVYSGKKRLFIVDLERNQIVHSGICGHGVGKKKDCIFYPKFSNDVGSNYSSLGHFKIGKKRKMTTQNLNCFELHGMDSSNSNAYRRGILIHDGMPDIAIIGLPCLPMSQGCFTVTSSTFHEIDNYLSQSSLPMLIYSTAETALQK